MNYHIVRTNESLEKIALTYQLSPTEIRSLNLHIRDWDHLIPGTKLKLPAIPTTVQDELDDVEPFIEDYYPRVEMPFTSMSQETPKMEKMWENTPKMTKEEPAVETEVLANEPVEEEPMATNIIEKSIEPQSQINSSQSQYKTQYSKPPTNPYYWYYNPYNAYANRYYMEQYYRMHNTKRKK